MNYIKQLNYYWKQHEVHALGHWEVSIYMFLLKFSNGRSWKNPIRIADAAIFNDLNFSTYRTLRNALMNLKQAELLKFEVRQGQRKCTYHLFNIESRTYDLKAEVRSEVEAEVGTEVDDSYLINNKLKQKPKPSPSKSGAEEFFLNENFYSHDLIEKATLFDESFLRESVTALKTDFKTFENFVAARLGEMKITGESSKYPLGTLRKILLQDFKKHSPINQSKNNFNGNNHTSQSDPKLGRIKQSVLTEFLNQKLD
ncbi:MAG: hypothetical protein JWO06_218 [Bacteroidota bacterium]|nr:hypothetical protein [Bacteroidota bacterium]